MENVKSERGPIHHGGPVKRAARGVVCQCGSDAFWSSGLCMPCMLGAVDDLHFMASRLSAEPPPVRRPHACRPYPARVAA
jgi:hypothetical protein